MKARPAAALALAAAALLAGCGGTATVPAASRPSPEAPPGGTPFLATSLSTAAGTWAVVVMGGSVANENNFWQLFARPAGSSTWKLVTPPGTADNGGLVLAGGAQSLITGFRPSQYLTYTPLTLTRDDGQEWSSVGPLDGALADVPDALAAEPGPGTLLALTTDGTAEQAAPGYTTWTTLATRRSLAATPAGLRCGLQDLTAAALAPPSTPLLGGTCSHPGTVPIFARAGGTWHAAGPAVPAALAGQDITVSRLTQAGPGLAALLTAGTGSAASLLAAWSADGGAHWTLSSPLPLRGTALASASFGTDGTVAVITTANRGEIAASTGSAWRSLPALPPGTATLAPGPDGAADALAVNRGTLTVWRLAPAATAWTRAQVIKVPIPYGSSS